MARNRLYLAELLLRRLIPQSFVEWRIQHIGILPLSSNPSELVDGVRFCIHSDGSVWDTALTQQAGKEIVDSRLRAGHRAVLATSRNELIGVVWFASNEYHDLDTKTTIQLSRNTIWLYGAWVRKDFRNRGIYRLLVSCVGQHVVPEGYLWAMFAVDLTNQVSKRVHERLGAKWIGKCRGYRVLCRGRYRVKIDESRLPV